MAAEGAHEAEQPACIACGESINVGARLCHHCGAKQRQGWRGVQVLAICAGLTTVLSLVFALHQGYRIWAEHRQAKAQLRQQMVASRSLKEVGDYAAAWKILTQAQLAHPDSRDLRAAQIQVAYAWLIEGYLPATGWIPRASASATTPAVSPGEAADKAYAPLVVAGILAEGTARADLAALTAWANLLRGRELYATRRDLGPDFRHARDLAPQAFTPNLLLGHWQASFANDPQAAMQSWEKALAADRDGSLVRRFQVSDLGARIGDEAGADDDRRALLHVLDDMQRNREAFPEALRLHAYLGLYVSQQFRPLPIAALAKSLAPERQLAVLEWVRAGFGIEPKRDELHFATFQLIRAYLLEQAGRTDEALATLLDSRLHIQNADRLMARFDEVYERLTGHPRAPDPERDAWGAHAYYLAHAAPGDARFEAAMAALRDWETTWDQVGDRLLRGKLPPALDAGVEAWKRELARAPLGTDRYREAARNLRFLHVFRGQVRADSYDFPGGIAELEAVAADPTTPQEMRAVTLFALAKAYTYSPRAPRPDNSRHDEQWQIDQAYLYEGLDRLAAALNAGFDDWARIERELKRLRDLPEYEAFSLRHGRVPRHLRGDD